MSFIEFSGITKKYSGSDAYALRDINLSIKAGEFLTLLGPSGSGKTTLLMLLAGFENPSSGHILLEGKSIESLPPYKRNMGVVFQSYSLFPHMSVAENVAFPLLMRKLPNATVKDRVRIALDKVRLADYGNRSPAQLSGGQQQRVALARALVYEPKLILMDEPLSALDKNLREEMQFEIRRLHRDLGVTMVFVTHDQAEAMTLSDRVALFNKGCIEQIADPQTLYGAPTNTFVANFVGDNNVLQGSVDRQDCVSPIRRFVRKGSGQVFFGRAHGDAAALPSDATLCVRPEFIHVEPSGTSSERVNLVNATLLDVIHQGDHWRLITLLDGSMGEDAVPEWVVKMRPNSLPQGIKIGETLRLGFRTEDAWIL